MSNEYADIERMCDLFDQLEGGLTMLVREWTTDAPTGCWHAMFGEDGSDESRLYRSLAELVVGETARLEALRLDREFARSLRREPAQEQP
jgi:hypothetical protein